MTRKTKKTLKRVTSRKNLERGAAVMAAAAMLVLVRRKLWYRMNAKPALHDLDTTLLPQSTAATPQADGGSEAEPVPATPRQTVPGIVRGYGEISGI